MQKIYILKILRAPSIRHQGVRLVCALFNDQNAKIPGNDYPHTRIFWPEIVRAKP